MDIVEVTGFSSNDGLGVVLVASSTGPLTAGESLTLSALGDGGTDFTYQFR